MVEGISSLQDEHRGVQLGTQAEECGLDHEEVGMESKYKVGDEVFYFDSFLGKIIGTKVKALTYDSYKVKTEQGGIICTEHYFDKYVLSSGKELYEYLLFDTPKALIDGYIEMLQGIKNLNCW